MEAAARRTTTMRHAAARARTPTAPPAALTYGSHCGDAAEGGTGGVGVELEVVIGREEVGVSEDREDDEEVALCVGAEETNGRYVELAICVDAKAADSEDVGLALRVGAEAVDGEDVGLTLTLTKIALIIELPRSQTNTMPPLTDEAAMPYGDLKRAEAQAPSTCPPEEPPASVLTKPLGVIDRMRLLPSSATYTVPSAATATPAGVIKLAAEPWPSADPFLALPANVLTKPFGEMDRIRRLFESAT